MNYPLVVKPADSQGGRGVTYVQQPNQLIAAVESALGSSRAGVAIVEEFIHGQEVTISVWVTQGTARILMITDRVTYNPRPVIGVAFQHVFPSERASGLGSQMKHIVSNVSKAYGLREGPLYIQALVTSDRRVVVNEAACRIGGGHENLLIPNTTGVDVTDRLIDLALTGHAPAPAYDFCEAEKFPHALVNFLLARPGIVDSLEGLPCAHAGAIREGEFYVQPGHRSTQIRDGQDRVGFFLVNANSRNELLARANEFYATLRLTEGKENLLFWPSYEELG